MRITSLLLLINMVNLFASDLYSQTNTFSLEMKDVTISQVLTNIEGQSEFYFLYNSNLVDVEKKVSVSAKSQNIRNILSDLFGNSNIEYLILNRQIILTPRDYIEEIKTEVQQLRISGKVIDENGEALIGVTVLEKGTTNGTITNYEGKFSVTVSPGSILVFSYIGYEEQEILVEDQTTLDITLLQEVTELDDVVVIGYGKVRKKDLTGSIAVVSSEDLNRVPASNFQQALQGQASGVLVSSNSGLPGTGASVKIRGIGSINREGNPVYVIDGIITTNLNSISPADIESMQVLKDASASAIYGADGANGVVIITTKRGAPGRSRVNYRNYFSFTRVPEKLALMDASQYAGFYNALNEEAGIFQPAYTDEFRQWYYGDGWEKGTDWQDEITRRGFGQNHYFRVSGGTESANYSISANYYNESGIMLNTGAKRINLRANSDFRLGKYFKIGETFSFSRMVTQNADNVFSSANIVSPLMKVYNENNKEGYEGPQVPYEYTILHNGEEFNIVNNTGGNDKTNPVAEAMIPEDFDYDNIFLGNLYLEAEPVRNLTYRLSGSVTSQNFRTKIWTPAYDLGVRSVGQASLSELFSESISLQFENQLTYSLDFREHSLTATAVHQVRSSDGTFINGEAKGFPYETLNVFSQAIEEGKILTGGYGIPYRMISYLGRLIYSYRGKILFTGSFRKDGVSRFKEGNRWGNFPSASIAYKINEDFLQNIDEINMLKIRFGWGKTGNSDIGDFLYDDFLNSPLYFTPVFGTPNKLNTGTYIFYSFSNPIIRWEAAEMLNLGMDISAFGNKIQVSAEYYWKFQNDLLVKVPVSKIFGRSGEVEEPDVNAGDPWANSGEVLNRGLEINVNYRNYDREFKYSVNLGLTTFHNEVKFLPKSEIIKGNTRTIEGRTIGSLYGYIAERILTPDDFSAYDEATGLYEGYLHAVPSEGVPQPGDLKFTDLNNDGEITDIDRTIIGKSLPDYTASLNFRCNYKKFDFSVLLIGMFNYQVFNQQRAQLSSFVNQDINHNKLSDWALNAYTIDNPSDEYVRADLMNSNYNDRISSWWVEDAGFVRVRDVQLGYNLPLRYLHQDPASSIRFYVSSSNPLLLTAYKGRDPENALFSSPLGSGTDTGGIPNPKVYTIGVQFDF